MVHARRLTEGHFNVREPYYATLYKELRPISEDFHKARRIIFLRFILHNVVTGYLVDTYAFIDELRVGAIRLRKRGRFEFNNGRPTDSRWLSLTRSGCSQ